MLETQPEESASSQTKLTSTASRTSEFHPEEATTIMSLLTSESQPKEPTSSRHLSTSGTSISSESEPQVMISSESVISSTTSGILESQPQESTSSQSKLMSTASATSELQQGEYTTTMFPFTTESETEGYISTLSISMSGTSVSSESQPQEMTASESILNFTSSTSSDLQQKATTPSKSVLSSTTSEIKDTTTTYPLKSEYPAYKHTSTKQLSTSGTSVSFDSQTQEITPNVSILQSTTNRLSQPQDITSSESILSSATSGMLESQPEESTSSQSILTSTASGTSELQQREYTTTMFPFTTESETEGYISAMSISMSGTSESSKSQPQEMTPGESVLKSASSESSESQQKATTSSGVSSSESHLSLTSSEVIESQSKESTSSQSMLTSTASGTLELQPREYATTTSSLTSESQRKESTSSSSASNSRTSGSHASQQLGITSSESVPTSTASVKLKSQPEQSTSTQTKLMSTTSGTSELQPGELYTATISLFTTESESRSISTSGTSVSSKSQPQEMTPSESVLKSASSESSESQQKATTSSGVSSSESHLSLTSSEVIESQSEESTTTESESTSTASGTSELKQQKATTTTMTLLSSESQPKEYFSTKSVLTTLSLESQPQKITPSESVLKLTSSGSPESQEKATTSSESVLSSTASKMLETQPEESASSQTKLTSTASRTSEFHPEEATTIMSLLTSESQPKEPTSSRHLSTSGTSISSESEPQVMISSESVISSTTSGILESQPQESTSSQSKLMSTASATSELQQGEYTTTMFPFTTESETEGYISTLSISMSGTSVSSESQPQEMTASESILNFTSSTSSDLQQKATTPSKSVLSSTTSEMLESKPEETTSSQSTLTLTSRETSEFQPEKAKTTTYPLKSEYPAYKHTSTKQLSTSGTSVSFDSQTQEITPNESVVKSTGTFDVETEGYSQANSISMPIKIESSEYQPKHSTSSHSELTSVTSDSPEEQSYKETFTHSIATPTTTGSIKSQSKDTPNQFILTSSENVSRPQDITSYQFDVTSESVLLEGIHSSTHFMPTKHVTTSTHYINFTSTISSTFDDSTRDSTLFIKEAMENLTSSYSSTYARNSTLLLEPKDSASRKETTAANPYSSSTQTNMLEEDYHSNSNLVEFSKTTSSRTGQSTNLPKVSFPRSYEPSYQSSTVEINTTSLEINQKPTSFNRIGKTETAQETSKSSAVSNPTIHRLRHIPISTMEKESSQTGLTPEDPVTIPLTTHTTEKILSPFTTKISESGVASVSSASVKSTENDQLSSYTLSSDLMATTRKVPSDLMATTRKVPSAVITSSSGNIIDNLTTTSVQPTSGNMNTSDLEILSTTVGLMDTQSSSFYDGHLSDATSPVDRMSTGAPSVTENQPISSSLVFTTSAEDTFNISSPYVTPHTAGDKKTSDILTQTSVLSERRGVLRPVKVNSPKKGTNAEVINYIPIQNLTISAPSAVMVPPGKLSAEILPAGTTPNYVTCIWTLMEEEMMTVSTTVDNFLTSHYVLYNITDAQVPSQVLVAVNCSNMNSTGPRTRTYFWFNYQANATSKDQEKTYMNDQFPINLPVMFSVLHTTGNNLKYQWTITETLPASLTPSVQHTFRTGGQKTVSVAVLNEFYTETVTHTVDVLEGVSLLGLTNDGPKNVSNGVTFTLEMATLGEKSCILWNMGDESALVSCQNPVSESSIENVVAVTVIKCNYPHILIRGKGRTPEEPLEIPSEGLQLQSTVELDCGNSSAVYRWMIFKMNRFNDTKFSLDPYNVSSLPQSTAGYTPYVNLKGSSFKPGLYNVTLKVVMVQHPLVFQKASIFLIKHPSPLQAVIEGGSARTVGFNKIFTIDGIRSSLDPDEPLEEYKNEWTFNWYCHREEEPLTDFLMQNVVEIPEILDNYTLREDLGGCFGTGSGRLNITSGSFQLDSSAMVVNTSNSIRLVITTPTNKSAWVEQILNVIEGDPPDVSIVCIKNCGKKVNPFSELVFMTNCTSCSPYQRPKYEWKLYEYLVDNKTYTEVTGFQEITSLTGTKAKGLAVKSNSLKGGHRYKLQVAASLPGYSTALTNDVITTALPPYGGSCNVYPPSGASLNTTFVVQCEDWINPEDDTMDNLGYELLYKPVNKTKLVLLYSGADAVTPGFVLPPANITTGYSMDLLVRINQPFHTYAEVKLQVQVKELEMDLDSFTSMSNSLESDLNKMISEGKLQEVTQHVTALAALLNDMTFSSPTSTESGTEGVTDGSSTILTGTSGTIWTTVTSEERKLLLEKKMKMREAMMKTLQSVDVSTAEGIRLIAGVLPVVTSVPDELSPMAQETALQKVSSITESLKENIEMFSNEDLSGVLEGLFETLAAVTAAAKNTLLVAQTEASADSTTGSVVTTEEVIEQTYRHQRVMEEALAFYSSLADAVLSIQAPGSEPITVKTKSFDYTMARQTIEQMDNAVMQGEDAGFQLPPVNSTLGENFLLDVVDFKMMTSRENPFTWVSKSDRITTAVASLTLSKMDGGEIEVKNTLEDILINIPVDPEDIPRELYVINEPEGSDMLVHHMIRVPYNDSTLHIILTPENPETVLTATSNSEPTLP
ncbi:uncharacterized protein LOC143245788 [Tachypleus tridentatus]|uniref:uncharacterized protein LOC143245788 n=1 Tax=Tachypleus tridentatus TaxID=6853 RepID=UPI003FD02C9E